MRVCILDLHNGWVSIMERGCHLFSITFQCKLFEKQAFGTICLIMRVVYIDFVTTLQYNWSHSIRMFFTVTVDKG